MDSVCIAIRSGHGTFAYLASNSAGAADEPGLGRREQLGDLAGQRPGRVELVAARLVFGTGGSSISSTIRLCGYSCSAADSSVFLITCSSSW